MDEQKKPRSREKRVVSGGKGVQREGEAIGGGRLNNTGSYADRKAQQAQQPSQASRPASSAGSQSRPQANPFQAPHSSSGGQSRPQANPFSAPHSSSGGQARPQSNPFSAPHSSSGGQARPQSNPFSAPHSSAGNQSRPASGTTQRASGTPQRSSGTSQRAGGMPSGCGSKMLLPIILVVVLLLGGGKLTGLFGGDGGNNIVSDLLGQSSSVSTTGSSTGTGSGTSSGSSTSGSSSGSSSSGSSSLGSLLSGSSGSGSSGGLTDLLGSLLSSGGSSVYDFTDFGSSGSGLSSLFSGGSSVSSLLSAGSSAGSSVSASSAKLDQTVAAGARQKYTVLKGKQKDTVTLLVYMCGSDLESRSGMGTSDLKEMAAATLGENVRLLVYTGGCSRWKNNVISSSVHQIYEIRDGGLYCLEKDMGSGSMTDPATLSRFIRYGAEKAPANRMCLIFWDHGGGSVSGFGYDEKTGSRSSMSLAGINTALKNGGVQFDFVGFDACLMATVETALMLDPYADYLIASEETEPGVGWYYTNWLNALGKNPSMSTLEIGKMIADDFVEVCNRQCRGQGTTLSLVDLAEMSATVPSRLKAFGSGTSELIRNQEYSRVSSARSQTREFAQSSKIDQVDLIHFARNLGTDDAQQLASALAGAVKYNRTGGGMTNANGLSIYFPYKRVGKVNQMVSTYTAIGMDEEYARCIQEFASLEVSGQVAGGTPVSSYDQYSSVSGSGGSAMPGLMDLLMGGTSASSGYSSGYASQGDLTDLLGGLFGGSSGSSGSIYDLFSGRSLTAESAAAYVSGHQLDVSSLVWDGNRIHLTKDQWNEITDVALNVFVADGEGWIDLGTDNVFQTEGDDLVSDYDGTWLSVDRQPIAYYYLGTVENGENEYLISGYAPALLNGVRVNLILQFDHERPEGYIAGAQPVYTEGETEVQSKNLIAIGKGDTVQFLCEYYDLEGNYQANYRLGKPITLGETVEIANTEIGAESTVATYRLTDLYQQNWWTPAVP